MHLSSRLINAKVIIKACLFIKETTVEALWRAAFIQHMQKKKIVSTSFAFVK